MEMWAKFLLRLDMGMGRRFAILAHYNTEHFKKWIIFV